MTREDVYDKCVEKVAQFSSQGYRLVEGKNMFEKIDVDEITWAVKPLLPREAIDAIIDCAVEEAVRALKGEQQ